MPRKSTNKPPTKAAALDEIADESGCSKSDVRKVLDALEAVLGKNIRKYGEFTIHGMVKVRKVHKKATAARPGRNPATGEAIMIKAKPAHDVIRVRVLKRVKDLA